MDKKPCERCAVEPRQKGKRFCKQCAKDALKELRGSGFLPTVPHSTREKGPAGSASPKEYDPSPWSENATRSLEESGEG